MAISPEGLLVACHLRINSHLWAKRHKCEIISIQNQGRDAFEASSMAVEIVLNVPYNQSYVLFWTFGKLIQRISFGSYFVTMPKEVVGMSQLQGDWNSFSAGNLQLIFNPCHLNLNVTYIFLLFNLFKESLVFVFHTLERMNHNLTITILHGRSWW